MNPLAIFLIPLLGVASFTQGQDKTSHYAVGYCAAETGRAFGETCKWTPTETALAAIGVSVAAGLAKEYLIDDKADLQDAAWTAAGGAVNVAVHIQF